jgi:hypothetical protein
MFPFFVTIKGKLIRFPYITTQCFRFDGTTCDGLVGSRVRSMAIDEQVTKLFGTAGGESVSSGGALAATDKPVPP